MSQVFTIHIEQIGLNSFTGRIKEMGDMVLVKGNSFAEVYYEVGMQLGGIIQELPNFKQAKIYKEIRLLARLYQV